MNSNIVFNTALACNSAETSILSPELDTDQEILKTLVDSIVSEQFSDTALYYLAKEPISISFTSDGLYLYSSLKNGNI